MSDNQYRGRIPKIDGATVNRILTLLKVGNTNEIAAEAAGITKATFYNWMKRGRKAKLALEEDEDINVPDSELVYVDFFDSVKKAKAEAIASAVVNVRTAMPTNWQAAMTFLERRDPDHWGRRDRLDVNQRTLVGFANLSKEEALEVKQNLHLFFPALGEPKQIGGDE